MYVIILNPVNHAHAVSLTIIYFVLFLAFYDVFYMEICREMKALVERQKLERRREAAHFQFAILHVAMWYISTAYQHE